MREFIHESVTELSAFCDASLLRAAWLSIRASERVITYPLWCFPASYLFRERVNNDPEPSPLHRSSSRLKAPRERSPQRPLSGETEVCRDLVSGINNILITGVFTFDWWLFAAGTPVRSSSYDTPQTGLLDREGGGEGAIVPVICWLGVAGSGSQSGGSPHCRWHLGKHAGK